MAKSIKVRKLVNPHGKKRKKKNPARRKKMTAKQIAHFGTKRQRAALKARRRKNTTVRKARKVKRNVAKAHRVIRHSKSNPVHRRKKRTVVRSAKRRASRASNPALVLTLGAANPPERRIKKVAQKKRKKSKNPRKTRKSRNATRVVVMAPAPRRRKKSNPARTRRHKRNPAKRHARRHNPEFMGRTITAGAMVTAVAGGLVGVAVAKLIPPLLPSQVTSSNLMKVVTTAVVAWAAGYAAGKFIQKDLGNAIMFGGFMQAGSVALNAFLPSVGAPLSLGAIVPGRFPIPQNPILDARNAVAAAAAPPAKSRVASMSGLERAFGSSAF